MLSFLLSDANFWFSVAIAIVLGLGAIEIVGTLSGFSLMSVIDDISPIEVDVGVDSPSTGISSSLSWLCLDRLPLMIWLVLLLTAFGVTGYLINAVSLNLFDTQINRLFSIPVALVLGLILTARLGNFIARLLPKNESSATHQDQFSGSVATITVGKATQHSPAEAKFTDQFKQVHYVMVEPIEEGSVFHQGDDVILVNKGPRSWMATHYK